MSKLQLIKNQVQELTSRDISSLVFKIELGTLKVYPEGDKVENGIWLLDFNYKNCEEDLEQLSRYIDLLASKWFLNFKDMSQTKYIPDTTLPEQEIDSKTGQVRIACPNTNVVTSTGTSYTEDRLKKAWNVNLRHNIFVEVSQERDRQDFKFGADRDYHPAEWLMILGEEVGEVNKAALEAHFKYEGVKTDYSEYRAELVQVAAVAVAMIEALDKKNAV